MEAKVQKKTGMTIEEEYAAKHPTSQKLFQRAQQSLVSGITRDGRLMRPWPIYITRANGSKKWDADGNEYIDLWSGHGALILGHNHPDVVAAVTEQINKGFHYSAVHELELELAELIKELIPCAEEVRFLQSGAEANMLAIRLARAYTCRTKVIKFRGHFHGVFDEVLPGVLAPFDIPMSNIGTPKEMFKNLLLANHNNSDDVRRLVESNDVACVIMEPLAAHNMINPCRPSFVQEVREITQQKGVVLIFDEVWSGFRCAPGGAQEILGVTPDLTSLAKCMGGGLPGSAVVGKKEIMDLMAYSGDPVKDRRYRVGSQGTHSANPVVCAAGIATLKALKDGQVHARINRLFTILKKGMNEQIKKHNIKGCVYGGWTACRFFLNHNCAQLGKCDLTYCTYDHEKLEAGMEPLLSSKLHLAMLLNGVDYPARFGFFSLNGAITEEDVEKIIEAFDRSLTRLQQENILETMLG